MKENRIFVCQNCGNEFLKWQGRCSVCGEWNTLREVRGVKGVRGVRGEKEIRKPEKLAKIKTEKFKRILTKIDEFDRVLGGGIVPGSLILLGGEPGIGKSTVLLEVANDLKNKVLYVSGEESKEQLKIRAERLGVKNENIFILPETDIDVIINSQTSYSLLIIDSIQSMYDSSYPSTPGSLVQVRECALKLQKFSKETKIPIILTSHVTKEGAVAGPKTLEHLVDVVLYLEGERFSNNRILHSTKNRFGATEEIGIFEMVEEGLKEVKNPSKVFLEAKRNVEGTTVTASLQGTRVFLVEVQALTTKTYYGFSKRISQGIDLRRLDLILAILEKRIGLSLSNYDVYINVVGGIKIWEPAADLAIASAIFSAFKNKKPKKNTLFLGEVGLQGEVRQVIQEEKRVKEAKKMGFYPIFGLKEKTLKEVIEKAFS